LKAGEEKEEPMKNYTPEQWDGLFRRLSEGGCPVLRDHAYKISPVGLSIETMPGMGLNEIFDLADGGTGYAIEVVLRNDSGRPIDILGFQIKTPWGIPKVSLVPAPRISSPKYPTYTFPGLSRYYDGDNVINHIFARQKTRLNPRQEIEGVIVLSSKEPMPTELQQYARTFVTLCIFDTRGNAYSAQFRLIVDRSELIARKRRENVERREAPVVHARLNHQPQNGGAKDARWRQAIPRGILMPGLAEHSPAPCTKSKYAIRRPAGKKRLSRKRGNLGDIIGLCAEFAASSGSSRRKRARPLRGG
jgi:hypothetical protein